MKFGNEPGVQEMEIYQAGSSQHNQRLRVTNVIAHGPGIKLLYGLAEASTNGDTIYAYRCRLRFCTRRQGRNWTNEKFLTVIGLPAGQLEELLSEESVAKIRDQLGNLKMAQRF